MIRILLATDSPEEDERLRRALEGGKLELSVTLEAEQPPRSGEDPPGPIDVLLCDTKMRVCAVTDVLATGESLDSLYGIAKRNHTRIVGRIDLDGHNQEVLGAEALQADTLTDRIIGFLMVNINRDLTRGELAGYLGMSQNHLARTFRRNTGMTIAQFVCRERVKLACELLSTTNLSVQNVSMQVGYTNPTYFSTVFRQQTGKSPEHFRHPDGAHPTRLSDPGTV